MPTPRTPYGEMGVNQALRGWLRSVYSFLESRFNAVTVTTTYSVQATDYFIAADASGGAFDITLPDVSVSRGREIIILRVNGGGNRPTIIGTVNGVVNPQLTNQYDHERLFCNGLAWYDVS